MIFLFFCAPAAPASAQLAASFPFPLDHYGSFVLDAPFAAPLAADERHVFVPLRTGTVVAFNVATNETAWSAELAADGPLVAAEGRVFVPASGAIHALNASTGALLWRTPAGALATSLAYRGGWLIVPFADGALQGIRASDGVVVWAKTAGAPAAVPLSIDGDLIGIAHTNGRVSLMDIRTGAARWQLPLGSVATGIAIHGDRVFVGTRDAHLWSLETSDGDLDWRWALPAAPVGTAAADGDRVYAASLDNTVRGFSRDTGNQRWSYVLATRPLSGPTLLDGLLVMTNGLSGRPGLVYINAKTGAGAGQTPPIAKVDETMRAQFPAVIVPRDAAHAFIATAVTGGGWHVHAYRKTLIPVKAGFEPIGPRYDIIWRLDVRKGPVVFGQRVELFTRPPG